MSEQNSLEFSQSTSSSLLERIKRRDQQGWKCFVELYGPLVYRQCRLAGLQAADAADVTQDVFIAVSKNVSNFQKKSRRGAFRGWLATITRNKLCDFFRAANRHVSPQMLAEHEELSEDGVASASNPERFFLLHQMLKVVRHEFEETTWQAFWRTTIDQHYPSDVANDLEMTLGAVYTAKSRVLKRLRNELRGLEGDF